MKKRRHPEVMGLSRSPSIRTSTRYPVAHLCGCALLLSGDYTCLHWLQEALKTGGKNDLQRQVFACKVGKLNEQQGVPWVDHDLGVEQEWYRQNGRRKGEKHF